MFGGQKFTDSAEMYGTGVLLFGDLRQAEACAFLLVQKRRPDLYLLGVVDVPE